MRMSKRKLKRIVAAIYIDPDYYPPTINAINNMAEDCEELVVVTRNHSKDDFPFPSNVRLVKLGAYASVRETENFSFVRKALDFIKYAWCFWKYSVSSRTELLVMYDPIPLFVYHLIRPFLFSGKTAWYHNHDMPNLPRLRKYSIGWFAATYEAKAMRHIDFFSLPSADRLQYYPEWDRSSDYFTIPNYPSLKVYGKPDTKPSDADCIRIIYQGFIGLGHGLEDIIKLMKAGIGGRHCRLILKGSVNEEYKQKLQSLANENAVADKIEWVGIGPYAGLPKLTASCHIGIGIHMNTDDVSKTLGTASNKIYEYAASGLPVLLYDNEQFRKYLSGFSWTYFTSGDEDDIRQKLEDMIIQRQGTSTEARKDFESSLNFEKAFTPIWNEVKKKVVERH